MAICEGIQQLLVDSPQPATGGFPSQRACNVKSISMSLCQHANYYLKHISSDWQANHVCIEFWHFVQQFVAEVFCNVGICPMFKTIFVNKWHDYSMIYENTFCVTGHLWGEFTNEFCAVIWSFDISFVVALNKLLNKQMICWWLAHLSLAHINGFVQERRKSIAKALDLHLSCINPMDMESQLRHIWAPELCQGILKGCNVIYLNP